MGGNGSYSVGKTLAKGAAPLGAVVGGIVLHGITKKVGQEIPPEHCLALAISAYGFWRGLRNWIK